MPDMEGLACTTVNELTDGLPTVQLFNIVDNHIDSASSQSQLDQSSVSSRSLEDRKRVIREEMRMRMENRRKDWDVEVEKLRRNFFQLKPASNSTASTSRETEKNDGNTTERIKSAVCKEGSKFHVCFDLSAFSPDEISVRTEERKLIVYARHEEKSTDEKRMITREFNRQVDIPRYVEPEAMQCTFTRDGLLQVEADAVKRKSSIGATHSLSLHKITPCPSDTSIASPNSKTAESMMFTISVAIGNDFEPEDLEVKTVDRKLVVSARRQVFCPGNTSTSEFHREFDLPDEVDPSTVTANMSVEGNLLIEAPLQLSKQPQVSGEI